MITAKAVVTLGRFMYGGWDNLKNHISDGGRLPFEYNWSFRCANGSVVDMEVIVIMRTLSILESM